MNNSNKYIFYVLGNTIMSDVTISCWVICKQNYNCWNRGLDKTLMLKHADLQASPSGVWPITNHCLTSSVCCACLIGLFVMLPTNSLQINKSECNIKYFFLPFYFYSSALARFKRTSKFAVDLRLLVTFKMKCFLACVSLHEPPWIIQYTLTINITTLTIPFVFIGSLAWNMLQWWHDLPSA